MTSTSFILLIVIAAGSLSSPLGLGGGIIMTPALTLPFHVDIRYTIGASIISVIAMSGGVVITYLKDYLTNVRVSIFLEIGTMLGVATDVFPSGVVDTRYLYLIFSLLVLYFAVMIPRKADSDLPRNVATHPTVRRLRLNSSHYGKSLNQEAPYQVAGAYGSLGMIYVAGTISGLLGIGSGAFKMMGMDSLMKLPMKVPSTMSNFMIGVTAATNAGVYFFHGDINPGTVVPVALGVLMGATVGTRVMQRVKSWVTQLVFVPALVIASVQMIVKGMLTG